VDSYTHELIADVELRCGSTHETDILDALDIDKDDVIVAHDAADELLIRAIRKSGIRELIAVADAWERARKRVGFYYS